MGDLQTQEGQQPQGHTADLRSVDLAELAGDRRAEAETVVRRILRTPGAAQRVSVAAFGSAI